MKKKDNLSQKDKEDWKNFLEDTSRIPDKDKINQLRERNETFSLFRDILRFIIKDTSSCIIQ